MACALEYIDRDGSQQTRLFIRMVDTFFDCLKRVSSQDEEEGDEGSIQENQCEHLKVSTH